MSNVEALSRAGADAHIRAAAERAELYRWFARPLVDQGLSLSDITRTLNAYPIRTPSGTGKWSRAMAKRLLIRLGLYGAVRQAA